MMPKIIELKQAPVVLVELEESPTKVEDSFANGFIYIDEEGYSESFYLDDICEDSKLVGILSDLTEEQFAGCVPKVMYSHIKDPEAIWYESYFHYLLESENVYTKNPLQEWYDNSNLLDEVSEKDMTLRYQEAQSRTIDPARTIILLKK